MEKSINHLSKKVMAILAVTMIGLTVLNLFVNAAPLLNGIRAIFEIGVIFAAAKSWLKTRDFSAGFVTLLFSALLISSLFGFLNSL